MDVPRHGWRRIAPAPAPRSAARLRPAGTCLVARLLLAMAFALGAVAAMAAPAFGATYYVSAAGSDSAMGTSPETPWRTLARVTSAPLAPGDQVLLRGGDGFGETLAPARSG